MTNLVSHEVNCETGEVTIRELTQKEIDAIEAQAEQTRLQMEAIKAEKEAKAAIKASALAKLAALGLSEEEAKAIAG
jgi:hypothetical protein